MKGGSPKVVDFSTHWSGPLASRELVQLGADVIKVESTRGGDGNRTLGHPVGDLSDVHFTINSGTRSLAFDAKSPEWPRVVAACARWADVVIVGARQLDARRRGLDFESISGHNPEIVYCAVTGYGNSGPWRDRTAHGLQPDLMAGVVPVDLSNGFPSPREDFISHGPPLAGLWAAIGILGALHRRSVSGGAQFVAVSMWEAALAWMWREQQAQANFGLSWDSYGDLGPRYSMYTAADGKVVLVCPIERKFWERFVEALELPPEWATRGQWDGGKIDTGRDYPQERSAIQERIAKRTSLEWEQLLDEAGVPVAAERTVAEAIVSDQARATGALTPITKNGVEILVPLPPVSVLSLGRGPHFVSQDEIDAMHSARGAQLLPPPELGENNSEILSEIGLTDLLE